MGGGCQGRARPPTRAPLPLQPTHHLDLHAVLWLEDFLVARPGTLLVVSHARDFLNAVCTDTVHLAGRRLTSRRGGFDAFLAASAEAALNADRQRAALLAERAHLQVGVEEERGAPRASARPPTRPPPSPVFRRPLPVQRQARLPRPVPHQGHRAAGHRHRCRRAAAVRRGDVQVPVPVPPPPAPPPPSPFGPGPPPPPPPRPL